MAKSSEKPKPAEPQAPQGVDTENVNVADVINSLTNRIGILTYENTVCNLTNQQLRLKIAELEGQLSG